MADSPSQSISPSVSPSESPSVSPSISPSAPPDYGDLIYIADEDVWAIKIGGFVYHRLN